MLDISKVGTPGYLESLSDKDLVELNRIVDQTRGQTDLYFLITEILGYKDLGSFHKTLCRVVESINPIFLYLSRQKYSSMNEARQAVKDNINSIQIPHEYKDFFALDPESLTRLFLLFRGSFKTTIISIAHTIQLMLIWPDIRMLISSHKKEGGSQEILGAIKRHFIGNDKFRFIYSEWCPKANQLGVVEWGTSEKVTLPNRLGTAVFPEATIEIAGATTDVTGRHYDYIKADDLVTRDSVTNETMLNKTEDYNALLKFLFNQPEYGVIDYSGTCYHFADIYAGLREQSNITKIIIPVTTPNGKPTFPERFTEKGIESLKNDPAMGSYIWSCQYLLNPVPESDQTFRPEWWKKQDFYYDELPNNLRYHIFVDPAAKQKKESDYTALITIGVDSDNGLYLVDVIRDKLDESGRARLVLDTCMKRSTHKVFYESIGFQSTDSYIIKKLSKEEDFYIQVEEIKASKVSKEDRIRGLQPMYERGDIHWPRKYSYYSKYHNRTIDMIDILKKEMWMFPKCEHDDLIDCHSFCLRVPMYKADSTTVQQPDDFFEKIRQYSIDSKHPKKEFHGFGNKLNNHTHGIPAKKAFF